MNRIRQVNLSDIPALQELYQHTVLTVNRKDYTAEEVADWASCGDDTSHWGELFEEQHYVVAENEEGVIVASALSTMTDICTRCLSIRTFSIKALRHLCINISKHTHEKEVRKD